MKFFSLLTSLLLSGTSVCVGQLDTAIVRSILVAEGTSKQDQEQFINKLQRIGSVIDQGVQSEKKVKSRHSVIFKMLHDKVLEKYTPNPGFSPILMKSEYNCVTASLLYCIYAKSTHLDVEIIETPVHVFLQFKDDDKEDFRVELTDPVRGFGANPDINNVLDAMLELKLVTKDEIKTKGKKQIYSEFVEKSSKITFTELLGILFFNLSISSNGIKSDKAAWEFCLKAWQNYPEKKDLPELMTNLYSVYAQSLTERAEWDSLQSLLLESTKIKKLPLGTTKNLIISADYVLDYLTNTEHGYFKALNLIDTLRLKFPGEKNAVQNLNKWQTVNEMYVISSYNNSGEFEKGYRLARKANLRDPNNSQVKERMSLMADNWLTSLIRQKKYPEAVQVADTLISHSPDKQDFKALFVTAYVAQAAQLYGTGKNVLASADPFLKRVLEIEPGNEDAISLYSAIYHDRAMEFIRKGNYKSALSEINRGLSYDPQNKMLLDDKRDLQKLTGKK